MKTKDVPAIVMLLAGAVYCLIGIRDKVPLWDFTIHLLIILLVFYVLGGIVKMVLDRFMGEIKEKESSEEEEEKKEESETEEETVEEESEEEESEETTE